MHTRLQITCTYGKTISRDPVWQHCNDLYRHTVLPQITAGLV